MKAKIHPEYVECTATCGCGATFKTRSTKPTISVETCSKCHPFYTGKEKLVDTAGRVERFRRKYAGVKPKKNAVSQVLAERTKKKDEKRVLIGQPSGKKPAPKKTTAGPAAKKDDGEAKAQKGKAPQPRAEKAPPEKKESKPDAKDEGKAPSAGKATQGEEKKAEQ